ncbi:MAG: hypothetical protein ACXQTS_06715 [Candidatus Methanospirareceae archaeon]
MPKCPICGKGIETLDYYEKNCWQRAVFFLYNGVPNYTNFDTLSCDETEYRCPECDELLFTDEEDAVEFLESGKIPEDLIPDFVERRLKR